MSKKIGFTLSPANFGNGDISLRFRVKNETHVSWPVTVSLADGKPFVSIGCLNGLDNIMKNGLKSAKEEEIGKTQIAEYRRMIKALKPHLNEIAKVIKRYETAGRRAMEDALAEATEIEGKLK